ncbi:hypothetical protein LTR64_006862 [Lithohypha guttulata]|uniref:uncharacterized protein n=1 Tax=Lithohypha guttulata TaxID=1690604 RepID=UPI002DE0D45C|nr:hypothetical protein LTR51_004580 [Lithohypha guttulata]
MSTKIYLITGANRGLGLEFVRQISSESSQNTILACVRSMQGELDDLKTLAKQNSQIQILECDTGSVESVVKCGQEVSKLLGNGQLHYLINNAGINSVPARTALDVTPEELRQHFEINVVGPNELVKAVQGHLREGSTVLNMTSGLASIGLSMVKCTAYAVSKTAMNMVNAHQAHALKEKGVRVIVMDPGWVKTRMGGDGAILEPHESISGTAR